MGNGEREWKPKTSIMKLNVWEISDFILVELEEQREEKKIPKNHRNDKQTKNEEDVMRH